MFNKKKILIFCSILTQISIIYAFPYRLCRLVLLDDNKKIQKTIDLISDIHIETHEKVKKPSRGQRSLLLAEEQHEFTTPERTLLIALRKLNTTSPEAIELLWEYVPGEGTELPGQSDFLKYGGRQAKKEFLSDNKINFKESDSKRERLRPDLQYMKMSGSSWLPDYLDLSTFHGHYNKVIDQINKEADQKENAASELAKNLHKKLLEFSRLMDIHSTEYGNKANLDTFFKYINKLKDKGVLEKILIMDLADYEFIYNVLNSHASHIIVYAGGGHCESVIKYIMQHGYIKIIDIDTEPLDNEFYSALSHKTWNVLLESPQKSLRRYYNYGKKPLTIKAPKNLIKEWTELLSDYEPMGDLAMFKKLQILVPQLHKTYTNFLEARNRKTGGTLLLHAVKNNYFESAKYLLKNQARPNARDYRRRTPLFHALYSPKMVELLLRNGADPYLIEGYGRKKLLSYLAELPDSNEYGHRKMTQKQLEDLINKVKREHKLSKKFPWITKPLLIKPLSKASIAALELETVSKPTGNEFIDISALDLD